METTVDVNNKFLTGVLVLLPAALGLYGYLTLEGEVPTFYHMIYGPFLAFIFGTKNFLFAVLSAFVIVILILSPVMFGKSYKTVFLSLLGILLWFFSAMLIAGILV